jgi:serine/threonine protein kinase
VYRCRNKNTGKLFACKVIDKTSILSKRNELLEQFQVEIRVLQSMRHPNIIQIEDVFESEDKIFMVNNEASRILKHD